MHGRWSQFVYGNVFGGKGMHEAPKIESGQLMCLEVYFFIFYYIGQLKLILIESPFMTS